MWVLVGTLLAALVLGFLLGPRPDIDVGVRAPEVPADVEGWIDESEARYPDLVPGTQKTIHWADPHSRAPTALSVVYLHGFSATWPETAPLAERVASRLGANLFQTRLTGHGRPAAALAAASLSDYLHDGLEALAVGRRLGERVLLIGTSTGGALATWVAAQARPGEVAGLVMLAPNFGVRDPRSRILLWPWGKQIARLIEREHSFEPSNPQHARYWTTRYPVEALVPMMALVEKARAVPPDSLGVPQLVLYSPRDEVVDPRRIEARFAGADGKCVEIATVEGSGDPRQHVLAGDILSPATTDAVAARIVAFASSAQRPHRC